MGLRALSSPSGYPEPLRNLCLAARVYFQVRFLLLLLIPFPALLPACSCGPLTYAPACELIGHAPVVLRGRVLGTEFHQPPSSTSLVRFARVRVDRVYQGLTPNTVHVLVDADPSDPCGQSYTVGEEYLFFAVPGPIHRAVPVVYTGLCSGSRPVSSAREDLRFLERYRDGDARTRIYGKTLQSVFRNRARPEIPAARATVTLRSRFQLREQISGADGSYSFDDVPPGDYEIFAALPRFRQTPTDSHLTIVPGGCAYRLFELKPETRLSGDAVHRDGTPVRNPNASPGNPSFARGKAATLP
jgi:hypothetical protein